MILHHGHVARTGDWQLLTDQVMGGVSTGRLSRASRDGRDCLVMTGDVRLENNGGFVQMALDLCPPGGTFDARAFTHLLLIAAGNGARYNVHLRTRDLTRVWQSYRASFTAGQDWATINLPLADFVPHRTDTPLNLSRLHRLGLVAIGQAMVAELAVAQVELLRVPS
ncbi:MAG: CIA30 family protein [Roseinatronobacter sp.]